MGHDIPHDNLLKQHARSHRHPLLFATVSGAHLYGFASPDSDVDLRGVHLLPASAFLGLDQPSDETISHTTIDDGVEIDLVTHDARKFFSMMLRRNGYVLEQLLSPLVVVTSPEHRELVALAPSCLTRHHAHHYRGFAYTTLRQLEKAPALKPLLYTYRVLLTGIHLMRAGEIIAHLPTLLTHHPQEGVDDLIARKREGREHDAVAANEVTAHRPRLEALLAQLAEAERSTHLPDAPSAHAALDALLRRARGAVEGRLALASPMRFTSLAPSCVTGRTSHSVGKRSRLRGRAHGRR